MIGTQQWKEVQQYPENADNYLPATPRIPRVRIDCSTNDVESDTHAVVKKGNNTRHRKAVKGSDNATYYDISTFASNPDDLNREK